MDPNVVLPLGSSILSLVFALLLIDQWRERRRPYQLIWAVGMLWYGLSAGTEFLGGWQGWSEPLYRAWYLIGAVWVAAWLGLGTVYLLRRTRFGYAFAGSLFLAGLFTFLAQGRYQYENSGAAPYLYFAVAAVLAVAIVTLTARGSERWADLAGVVVVGGTVISAALMASAAIPGFTPAAAVDPQTHIPTGALLPGYLRLLTPFFNITGAFALGLGALYSAYVFMPKRRVIRYSLARGQSRAAYVRALLLAAAAIPVNFVVSLPGAVRDLLRGRLNSRVPATILIALGALIPAYTSGLNRFGSTSGFFVGEFLGVVFLFLGYLVSIEVMPTIRVPFTRIVLRAREVQA
jgi:hypothetical protein